MQLPLSYLCLGIGYFIALFNLLFVSHHGNLCGKYKNPRPSPMDNEIRRYQKYILVCGIIAFAFIAVACILNKDLVGAAIKPFGIIKILIPPIVWILGFIPQRKKLLQKTPAL